MWKKVAILCLALLFTTKQGFALTLDEYRDQIRATVRTLEVMEQLDPGSQEFQRKIKEIRLPLQDKVLFGEQEVNIDNAWLKEALTEVGGKVDRVKVIQELKNGLIMLESSMEGGLNEDLNPKPVLLHIIRRMELVWLIKGILASPFALLASLLNLIRELLRKYGLMKVVLYILYALIPLIALGILSYILKKLQLRSAKRIEGKVSEVVEVRDADWLRNQAEEYATRGDYHMAIRFLYLSLLRWLEEKGIIEYDPTKTNGEYLNVVQSNSRLYEIFSPLTSSFDNIWYGSEQTTESVYQKFQKGYLQLEGRV